MTSHEVVDDLQVSGMSSADFSFLIGDSEVLQNIEEIINQEGANLTNPGAGPQEMNTVNMDSLNFAQPKIEQAQTLNQIHARSTEPWVQIIEQPKSRGLRFRYECEGRSAGSIPGESSTNENRTFPIIQIHNSGGSDAIVVVSCVSKEQQPQCKPHPHSLVGKDCQKGVCTVRLKKTNTATFSNLGIQCAKKKDIKKCLEERKHIRVDPFSSGFKFDPRNIDLSVVRLCFQVFLPDKGGKFNRIVPPVVSQCIYDKKAVNDLVICRISKQAGSVRGGDEVFLLCEKVSKDDIEIRFYEESVDGVMWEARGDFGVGDVHRQFAIVFKTPPYRDMNIRHPVKVSLQLKRSSDGETSDPLEWQYYPSDPDPDLIDAKRKRKRLAFANFIQDQPMEGAVGGFGAPDMMQEQQIKMEPENKNWNVKERLKLKASRNKTKSEAAQQAVQQQPSGSFPMQGLDGGNMQPNFSGMLGQVGFDPHGLPGGMLGNAGVASTSTTGTTSHALAGGFTALQHSDPGMVTQQSDSTAEGITAQNNLLSGLSDVEGGNLNIDEQTLMQYFNDGEMQSNSFTRMLLNSDLNSVLGAQVTVPENNDGETLPSDPNITDLHEQLTQLNN